MFRISDLRSLAGPLAVIVLVSGLTPLPVQAKTKLGEKAVKEGRLAEAKKDFDRALELYEQAFATDPRDSAYVLLTQRARFYASQTHVDAGQKARNKGDLETALIEFTKGMQKDPSSAIAIQEWKRTQEMIDRNKKPGAKVEDKALTPQQAAQKDVDDRIASLAAPPELRPISKRIDVLKINNQPAKVLFDTLGKMVGVNVVYDPQFGTAGGRANFNVDLSNSNLESALDYLCMLTKSFWKPMNENTIFIAEDNVTKRRDYIDNVVKVFYVQNATSVQEFQEITTAVRSVTEIRRVYSYNAQKAILVRGPADAVMLAEKLIRDLDKPKAEVVVDIMVLEVNSTRTRQLAATIANGGTTGLNLSAGFVPRSTLGTTAPTTPGGAATTGTSIGLQNIGKLDFRDFQTSLPGALLQAVASDNSTRIMQRPQVRASDGQKVTLKIGDKVPIATGSFTPSLGGVSGAGGTGLISSTQFNFTDVGIILDMTPQVHGQDEVTLKLSVEVSTINSYVTIGGISQPVIGQRKTETELRLREGEINILGGLLNSQDSRNMSGIPGLINLPFVNKFFGNESINKTQQDVLIAIMPHIVRTPIYTAANYAAIASGNETDIKLTHVPKAEIETPVVMPPKPSMPVAPPPAAVVSTQPAQPTVTPEPSGDGPVVLFSPGGELVTPLSGSVTFTLTAKNMKELFAGDAIKVRFPAALLRLNEVLQGEMLSRDGQRVLLSKDIRNDAGEATISLKRIPGAPGVSGDGTLLTFQFMAIGKGSGQVQFEDGAFKNAQNQPISVPPTRVSVRVN